MLSDGALAAISQMRRSSICSCALRTSGHRGGEESAALTAAVNASPALVSSFTTRVTLTPGTDWTSAMAVRTASQYESASRLNSR